MASQKGDGGFPGQQRDANELEQQSSEGDVVVERAGYQRVRAHQQAAEHMLRAACAVQCSRVRWTGIDAPAVVHEL